MADRTSSTGDKAGGGGTNGNGPDAPSTVNPQIVDAVTKSTEFVFGLAPTSGASTITPGAAIAYEKAAQAASLWVQDAEDYQRNVMSVSNVAQGKALAMMFVDKENIKDYAVIFILAIVGSLAGTLTAGLAGVEAGKVLSEFPKN